ncbi:MAG: IPTL-CTERM sorting domain-containing protein [Archangium sp.]|nr:IPTL-CTERM sorting domain-containing protein [Archangium sp.]
MKTGRSMLGLVVLFPFVTLGVPTFTSSGGSTAFLEDAAAVPIDPTLTLVDPIGPDIAGARVSITSGLVPSEDVLSVTNQLGITGSYSAATGILTLSGTASAATFQTVLRTVKYQNTQANNPTAGVRQITFSLSSSSLFFPTTGHYYEFVSASSITWTAAKTAAEGRTYFGLQGYLVTVTSAGENDFIRSKLVGTGWMGASASIFTVPRTWSWVTGPEATTDFFTQTTMGGFNGGGVAIGGLYSNWDTWEPNTNAGIEQYAHFFSDGTWNDYDDNIGALIQGYVCEYGGMPGDPTPTLSGTKSVQVSACETGCSTCSSATACTTCDNGLTLSSGDCLGAVPTLSEWGMIIFTAIMAGGAFLSLRRQQLRQAA